MSDSILNESVSISREVKSNRISDAFHTGKKLFIAFITGGDPDIETTKELIKVLVKSGADIIEIGVPFSDPVAEGLVIQKADERALLGGCTVDKLFDMVRELREIENIKIPLLLMTYLNPVYVYGKERFVHSCATVGIDGVIVPDMPYEERDELLPVSAKFGVNLISMIAPTSDERIDMIAGRAEGFLYCVSSLGVTGVRDIIDSSAERMIKRVRCVSDIPCAVGFGISTPAQASAVAKIADGVIVGSAIVKLVGEYGRNSAEPVARLAKSLADSIFAYE